jgi:MFS transporter, ACS family, hexuronate transporter
MGFQSGTLANQPKTEHRKPNTHPSMANFSTTLEPDSSSRQAWVWAVALVLLAATFLNYANRFAFTQNALLVQEEFGLTEEGYGRLEAYFGLGFAFGGLLFGVLADVISVRLLFPLVVLVWSLAGMASGFVESFAALLACRFVLGLFEAGHWSCSLRTTQRIFTPDQRTWGNSVLQSGASVGAIATPLLIAGLHLWYPEGWRWALYIAGALGIPWIVWWLLTIREADVRRPVIQTDETSVGTGRRQELEEIPFLHVFLTRRWWVLLVVVLSINTVWHYIRVWLPLILEKDHGYSRLFMQYFTSAYYLATLFGSLTCGWLTAHLAGRGWNVHRARLTVFFVFALLTALSVPAAFASRGPLLLGLLLMVAFGSLGLFPIYYSFNQEISARNQGKVGGSLGFVAWISMYYIHPFVGRLVDVNPDVRPYLFAAVGLAPLVGFAVLATCWGRRPTARRSSPAPA